MRVFRADYEVERDFVMRLLSSARSETIQTNWGGIGIRPTTKLHPLSWRPWRSWRFVLPAVGGRSSAGLGSEGDYRTVTLCTGLSESGELLRVLGQSIRHARPPSPLTPIRASLRLEHPFIPGPRRAHRAKKMETPRTQRPPRTGAFRLTSLKLDACL
jgi:hypothetical protein